MRARDGRYWYLAASIVMWITAGMMLVMLVTGCATQERAPRYPVGLGMSGRWVCVDTETGAMYLLRACDQPRKENTKP